MSQQLGSFGSMIARVFNRPWFPNTSNRLLRNPLVRPRTHAFTHQSGRCFYCGIPMWADNPLEFATKPASPQSRPCTSSAPASTLWLARTGDPRPGQISWLPASSVIRAATNERPRSLPTVTCFWFESEWNLDDGTGCGFPRRDCHPRLSVEGELAGTLEHQLCMNVGTVNKVPIFYFRNSFFPVVPRCHEFLLGQHPPGCPAPGNAAIACHIPSPGSAASPSTVPEHRPPVLATSSSGTVAHDSQCHLRKTASRHTLFFADKRNGVPFTVSHTFDLVFCP